MYAIYAPPASARPLTAYMPTGVLRDERGVPLPLERVAPGADQTRPEQQPASARICRTGLGERPAKAEISL